MWGGWALGCGLHPGGRRAGPECPVSLCSVLDDEGSNLRQQKLDRQVSGAGPGGRAVSTYQPAWRGRIVSLPGGTWLVGTRLSRKRGEPSLDQLSMSAAPEPGALAGQAAGAHSWSTGHPCCGPAGAATWADLCLLFLDPGSQRARGTMPWPGAGCGPPGNLETRARAIGAFSLGPVGSLPSGWTRRAALSGPADS